MFCANQEETLMTRSIRALTGAAAMTWRSLDPLLTPMR
jgi:hypothetical protein